MYVYLLQAHFVFYRLCRRLDRISINNIFLRKVLRAIVLVLYWYYGSLAKLLYGAFVPYKANIGARINFVHSLHGIFISQAAVIGDDCTILHHVTIGSDVPIGNRFNNGKAPVIGNRVFIGCNASIIGKVEVGDDSRIGAGVTIANRTIKPKSTVVSSPNKIFVRDE